MKTLKERLDELKDRFEKRRKEIDVLVARIISISEKTEAMVEGLTKLIKELQEGAERINKGMDALETDYKKMKENIDNLKNNWWLKLFGVK